jgi:outer membrane protein OmpA-like peptidoglycan-associated protein
MRFIPLLTALSLLLTGSVAHAACQDVVQAAASEAQMGAGLASTTLRDVREACGETGPSLVVDALVDRGVCDEAAQLGRSLSSYPGINPAIARADECIVEQFDRNFEDLDALANNEPEPDAAAWGGVVGGLDEDESQEALRSGSEKADRYYGSDASDLGTRGSGYGGGGTVSGLGAETSSRPASSPAAGRSSRESERRGGDYGETAGPEGKRRKYKGNTGASTGMGRYLPTDDRVAVIPKGTEVAWSQMSLRVWFDYDSAALRPEAIETLVTISRQVETMGEGTVLEILGHTDSTGSWWYNDDLSVRRARSVEQALLLAGVASNTVTIRGMGEGSPSHDNYSEWGRARNRRVEFRFYRPVAARQITN